MGKRQRFENDEERHYLTWNNGNAHTMYWQRRTVIFHYSNGTNRCSITGCDADVDILTLDHEEFNALEISEKFGYKNAISGKKLVNMLLYSNFPDLPISVKCMYHNSINRHPKNKEGKYSKGELSKKIKAYAIYGYTGTLERMSWEHSYNDGAIHRKYLKSKYNLKYLVSGSYFNVYIVRESKLGLPNWPGLMIKHMNDNHRGGKGTSNTVNYDLFWTEDKYKPFRDSLLEKGINNI